MYKPASQAITFIIEELCSVKNLEIVELPFNVPFIYGENYGSSEIDTKRELALNNDSIKTWNLRDYRSAIRKYSPLAGSSPSFRLAK
jgi:hypothetical protein